MDANEIQDHMELMRFAAELQKEEKEADLNISRLIKRLKPLNITVNELREKRDIENQNVKTHIELGGKLQAERNDSHKQIGRLKNQRKQFIEQIKALAQQISQKKEIRDSLNQHAKGRLEVLEEQYRQYLSKLVTDYLFLKDEKFLFDRIGDLKSRYLIKRDADAIHAIIQENYEIIKKSEQSINELNETIDKITQEAQKAHDSSVAEFKKKGEISAQAQEFHNQYIANLKELKRLQAELDDFKKRRYDIKRKREKISKRLGRIGRSRDMERTITKLATAKEKMEKKQGLGLEDLRVLMDSGALKVDRTNKSQKKRGKK